MLWCDARMPAVCEAELVRAVASGSEDAANLFVDRFRDRIDTLLRRRKIPVDDRGDVTQQTLADALRQIREGRFRGDSSLQTWLYTIVKGKAADYWRRRGPHTVSLQTVPADDPAFATSSLDADQVLAVQQALSRLAAEDQVVLLLHDAERYTLEEIGQMIGLRKSAVAKRLERAREHFRATIGRGGNSPVAGRLTE
jgi:RNA polymerase sigma-70 factor, ECF subfamily